MAIPDGINTAFGATFAPTRESAELAPQRARTEGLQEAIRVLSLHVPQVLGGRPVAAGELLRASGGGDPVSAVVESVLRSVMGGQAAAGPTVGAAGGPSAPGAVRAVGTAPSAPDTSAMLAQAVRTLAQSRALPRITPGMDPILHVAQEMQRGRIPSRVGDPFGFEAGALQTFAGTEGGSLFDTTMSLGKTGEERQRALVDFFKSLQDFESRQLTPVR